MSVHQQRGQSLIELVVGIGIGVLFVTAAIGIIVFSLRLDFQNKFSQTAAELNQQMVESVITLTNADWHNLYGQPRLNPLHTIRSAGFLALQAASSTTTINDVDYESSFAIEDVCRDGQDGYVDCPAGSADPSTLKITVATQWQQGANKPELRLTHYLNRVRDRVWNQNDWSSGSSSWNGSPFTLATMSQGWFSNATNTQWTTAGQLTILNTTQNLQTTGGNGIDTVSRYAWNDVVGWFDFRTTNTVTVGSTLTGYARSVNATPGMSPIGDLALDCTTSPNGNICGGSNFVVAKDTSGTSAGILSGYGWNDNIGWVSFNCSNNNSCATTAPCPTTNPSCTGPSGADYNVRMDSQGDFYGFAWSDTVGWISFNCNHTQDSVPGPNLCLTGGSGTSDYKVKIGSSQVAWGELESIPFDTQRAQGAGYNTMMWQGVLPNDTNVRFQIAEGDSAPATGPWQFKGPDGTALTYYQPAGPNVPIRINRSALNNKRYVVYRIILESDPGQTLSPTVNNVIINWSH